MAAISKLLIGMALHWLKRSPYYQREEIFSEMLVGMPRLINRTDPARTGNLKAYLFRRVYYLWADAARRLTGSRSKRPTRRTGEILFSDLTDGVATAFLPSSRRGRGLNVAYDFDDLMELITPIQRDVLWLRIVERLTPDEIAVRIKKSKHRVYQLFSQAIARIRRVVKREER